VTGLAGGPTRAVWREYQARQMTSTTPGSVPTRKGARYRHRARQGAWRRGYRGVFFARPASAGPESARPAKTKVPGTSANWLRQRVEAIIGTLT